MITSSAGAGTSRKNSYFALSRAHRYSILFALPLLLAYETLAALLAHPGAELRNGADVMLRSIFTSVAGPRGSLIFMAVVILAGLFFVVRDMRANRAPMRPGLFVLMLAEAAALAATFGIVIGLTTAKLLGSLHALSILSIEARQGPGGALAHMPWTTRLMLSLGAGIYEELFFRVLLVGGLAAGARAVLGASKRTSGVIAAVLGAVVFSAFHYIGPYGDRLELQSFTFRMLSGLAFSALYLVRGFGITAWTHALYDAFLLLGG
jgi:hypothetical protein